jgi:hypothetical protein
MVGGDGVATPEDLLWCPHPSTRGGAAAGYSAGLGLRYQPTSLKRGEGPLVAVTCVELGAVKRCGEEGRRISGGGGVRKGVHVDVLAA